MNLPEVKGWCPGALRPMMSGDGLVVRVRPRLCHLSAEQVVAICEAAKSLGSGIIELTSRANIQLRGVAPETHPRMVECLTEVGLLDDDADLEARDNIIVTPFWQAGDDTARIATELKERLAELPELPAKFGFAVDAGEAPLLTSASADIRVERCAGGNLLVRADGAQSGSRVTLETAVDEIISLGRWFMETGGRKSKRMKHHLEETPLRLTEHSLRPSSTLTLPKPGTSELGAVYGAVFGRFTGEALVRLMQESGATALRTTPWRRFILEGAKPVRTSDFITDASDPIQNVDVCPGAPYCNSATVETHALARALAGRARGRLHVSGCTKGCARSTAAPLTLVGRQGTFDIVRDGSASDAPEVSGLEPVSVMSWFGDR